MLYGIGTFSQEGEKKKLLKRIEPGPVLGYVSYVCFIN